MQGVWLSFAKPREHVLRDKKKKFVEDIKLFIRTLNSIKSSERKHRDISKEGFSSKVLLALNLRFEPLKIKPIKNTGRRDYLFRHTEEHFCRWFCRGLMEYGRSVYFLCVLAFRCVVLYHDVRGFEDLEQVKPLFHSIHQCLCLQQWKLFHSMMLWRERVVYQFYQLKFVSSQHHFKLSQRWCFWLSSQVGNVDSISVRIKGG